MAKIIQKEKNQVMGIAAMGGVALALYYLNEYEGVTYSLQDLTFHAAEYCNHRRKNSGRNLQAKYLEWKYISQPGFPYYLTGTLSNILMAKARIERFGEAIEILKIKGAREVIARAELDYKEFLKNNPKLAKYTLAPQPAIIKKAYQDGTDIFQVLEAIKANSGSYILNEDLDDLYNFVAGYKLLARETKTNIKNLEKFDQFSSFLKTELNEEYETAINWFVQLHSKFGSKRGFIKFFVYLESFKKINNY